MKIFVGIIITFLGTAIYAGSLLPLFQVDFTEEKCTVSSSQAIEAAVSGEVKFLKGNDSGIFLDGKKSYVILNGTESFSLKNGGTFFAVVRFADDGQKDATNEAHDTVIYKKTEFLFGRSGKFLYFLSMNKNKTGGISLMHPNIPTKQWITIAAVIRKDGEKYDASLFINGKKVMGKPFVNCDFPASGEPITIGDGWGGCWMMHGDIAEIKIFDRPLTSAEIRDLDDDAPNLN